MKITRAATLFYSHGMPVILQELEDDHYAKFCIQFRGSGHYFATIDNVAQYINSRWQQNQRWAADELLKILRSGK